MVTEAGGRWTHVFLLFFLCVLAAKRLSSCEDVLSFWINVGSGASQGVGGPRRGSDVLLRVLGFLFSCVKS